MVGNQRSPNPMKLCNCSQSGVRSNLLGEMVESYYFAIAHSANARLASGTTKDSHKELIFS